jgi:hypothetical protein
VLHDSWLRNIFCEQWMVQTHHTPPCWSTYFER